MKLIPLLRQDGTLLGHSAVDDGDYAWLNQWTWRIVNRYAARSVGKPNRTLFMHREILGLTSGDGIETDHRNRDKLDNRRANLRVVTHAQNMQNFCKGGRSRHRGVYLDTRRSQWIARGTISGVTHWLGSFKNEDEAGRVAADFRALHMPFSEEFAA